MPILTPVITEEQLSTRIKEIGREIRADFGDEPVWLVGILKGSYHFLSDLSRNVEGEVFIDFMRVSSYGHGRESSGAVQILKDMDNSAENQNIIIVEDIVDSGLTLTYLRKFFEVRHPKCVKVATLLDKPDARIHPVKVDYIGFQIPNDFVVGYGLDDAERYRNLPYVAKIIQ